MFNDLTNESTVGVNGKLKSMELTRSDESGGAYAIRNVLNKLTGLDKSERIAIT
ncbi:hypothetical protein VCR15J2_470842 [Vibrio coralliirubri]|uniref:Uncharacterized protein n=1 Tax=Vibrio coralliirubri TaxID=1516159 RepID=A0AA86XPN4_9VIBR|nr:hypothetical protein VCR31J2_1270834 [Vibrio coralliirubri]CDT71047.1 hypothetical protein VCR15J2_470842 [Vibrio coralliirubri]